MSITDITDAELKFWAEMAARQAMLHALRPYGGDDFRSVAREAMPRLIAEVERLRSLLREVATMAMRLPEEHPSAGDLYAIGSDLWERLLKESGQ